MNVLSAMLLLRNDLPETSTRRLIIDKIIANIDEAKDATIYDIAELCNVSPSSITRLCDTLGYATFNAFKQELKDTCENYEFHNRILPASPDLTSAKVFHDVVSLIKMQAENVAALDYTAIERIADLIHGKKHIHCFNEGYYPLALQQLEINLLLDSKEVYYHGSRYIEQSKMDEDSLAIFFCPNYPKKNPMLPLFEIVSQTPAYTIAIAYDKKEYWDKADYTFYISCGTQTILDHLSMNMIEYVLAEIYRAKYLDH